MRLFAVVAVLALTGVALADVVCPDGQSECPDGDTCCTLGSGQYGCCPIPNAVCCSDHLHCCPEGYTCDVSAGTCTKEGETLAPSKAVIPKLRAGSNYCDYWYYCDDTQDCCYGYDDAAWYCCSSSYPVCCTYYGGCCPYGYYCSSDDKCYKYGLDPVKLPMLRKHPAMERERVKATRREG